MPTYDYECTVCGHEFEAFQSISAKPLDTCPECGKALRRLIGTGAGILFKGTGFYQTDYRSAGYQKEASADRSRAADPKKDKKSASNQDAKKAQ